MNINQYKIEPGSNISLEHIPTLSPVKSPSKEDIQMALRHNSLELNRLQDVLYAQNIYALLVVLQALDAAGKDSLIKYVFTGVNPQGCSVTSFKQPSSDELDHDYLWRAMIKLPEKGKIGIFNRSYYEDVVAVRVHPEWLDRQQLPEKIKYSPDLWKQRFRQIKNFERHLHENSTIVVKLFLHVSKETQKKRLLQRLDNPDKLWKFSESDVYDRMHRKEMLEAYSEAISETSSVNAPWFVVPADNKWLTRLIASDIIIETLQSLNLKYPNVHSDKKDHYSSMRKILLESDDS